MDFPELTPAFFVKKESRFTAGVRLTAGGIRAAFIPTTGWLTGVLTPGCRVWLERSKNPDRKTPFTLVLSELPGGGLCSTKAYLVNALFGEAVKNGRLSAFPYETIEREALFDRSRLDFRLSNPGETCGVEVKSVTFVENGVGMFPDAPTDRGRKHLGKLEKLAAQRLALPACGRAWTMLGSRKNLKPRFAKCSKMPHAAEGGSPSRQVHSVLAGFLARDSYL